VTAGAWTVAPGFAVRVAGLPATALAALRFEQSFALAKELTDLGDWLAAEGASVSETLHGVIAGADAPALRPRLIGLRRALYRVRFPSKGECAPAVMALLPPDVQEAVTAWLERFSDLQAGRRRLDALLAEEAAAKREALLLAAEHPGFRRALSQASPALFDELEKWRQAPQRTPSAKMQQRLANYLSRAAAKTSPYSTFTVSGLGAWTERGDGVRLHPSGDPACVIELDGAYLEGVRRALAVHPQLLPAACVRLNASATPAGERLAFIGPPPAEAIVTIDPSPVRRCIDALQRLNEPTAGDLADHLQAATGATRAGTIRHIRSLVDAGLVQANAPVSDNSVDPMGELGSWVAAQPPDGALGAIVPLIADVRRELRRDVPIGDVDGHKVRLHRLQASMRRLGAELGLPSGSSGALRGASGPAGGAPQPALHESAIAGGRLATCSLHRWQPALDDLDVVRRFLALFDAKLPTRLELGTWMRDRFGSGQSVPFLQLYRKVQEEVALQRRGVPVPGAPDLARWTGAIASPRSPAPETAPTSRLALLAALQSEARAAVLSCGDDDGIVRVDPVVLAKLVSSWPEWVRPPASVACYVQPMPCEDTDDLRLVLNVVHGGHGRGLGRLRHLVRQAHGTDPLPQDLDGSAGRVVLAELGGLHASTLNARAASTFYEVEYPFTVSERPASQRIRLGDLSAVHDAACDLVTLRAASPQGQVVPLHLGMSADFLLPPAARFLERAFGAAYLVHPSMLPLAPPGQYWRPGEIVRSPRIEVGHVVVQRARWFVPAHAVPSRAAGETDGTFLLRLLAWLRREELPTACFVRAWGDDLRGEQAKTRKPMYIDFASGFLTGLFEREVRNAKLVLFDEALPSPADAFLTERASDPHDPSLDDRRVIELMVQIGDADASDG
jgi:hypothetical protein